MLNRPSAVNLISNPTPDVSTHEWIATNVKSMNRTNKLSSTPFYVPNDMNRKHQFRLVLLRGVVKGDTEEKDPIAVYLEYLPPSSDLSSSTTEAIEHPGNCKIAVWCVNRFAAEKEETAHHAKLKAEGVTEEAASSIAHTFSLSRTPPHRYDETTFAFSATERMVGFKEILPAKDLGDDAMVDPNAFNAMTIRVEITRNVTSVVDVVAKTTDRWASSLWGSATSAFAVLQTGIGALKSQVLSTIEERLESGGDAHHGRQVNAVALPWEEVPHAWTKAGRSLDEWRTLITRTIVEDEGTFLYGAERGLHADEQVLMTQLGLNHKAIMNAATLFDFDRDVHEGLLTVDSLRKQRYRMVPKLISDKRFWGNYMWKVAALSTAPKDDQIHLLMSIVNAPPLIPKGPKRSNSTLGGTTRAGSSSGAGGGDKDHSAGASSGGSPSGDASGDHNGPSSAADESQMLLLRFEKDVAANVKSALEATEVLQELVDDAAEEVFITTAVQSCQACEAKIAELSLRLTSCTSLSDKKALAALVEALATTRGQLETALTRARAALAGEGQNAGADLSEAEAAAADKKEKEDVAEDDKETEAVAVAVNTSADAQNVSVFEVPHASSLTDLGGAAEEAEQTPEESAEADEERVAIDEKYGTSAAEAEEVTPATAVAETTAACATPEKVSEKEELTADEMTSPAPQVPTTAATQPTAAGAPAATGVQKPSTSVGKTGLDFLDEDFSPISTHSVNTKAAPSVSAARAPSAVAAPASKTIEFEPMPWDDE